MKTINVLSAFVLAFLSLIIAGFAASSLYGAETARGVVYHDANANGERDGGEPGIAGVLVSNGRDIVAAEADGAWELEARHGDILFVIKPRDWQYPLNEYGLPQFFHIHAPEGSPEMRYPGFEPTGGLPESIDFALHQQEEGDSLKVLVLGDTQTENQQEIDWYAHDIVEELLELEGIAFGSIIGDVVNNDLTLYDALNQVNAAVGIPWHHVHGNHDMNYDAISDVHSDDAYERVFGPTTHAFQYGPAHFIVLDDVVFQGKKGKYAGYTGGFRPEQFTFVENYLARVPQDALVVLMMHIPLFDEDPWGDTFRDEDREKLFTLLSGHPHTLSISAHTHIQQNHYFKEADGWLQEKPHHHYNIGTACGSWWTGIPDERGIPDTMMRDGTPNGYAILNITGNQYVVDWKVARRPAGYVMNIDSPEVVKGGEYPVAKLSVNVFNGDEHTKVEYRVNKGEWKEMRRVLRYDPVVMKLWARYEFATYGLEGRRMNPPSVCSHLWEARIPNRDVMQGLQLGEVRVTDRYGRVFTGHRTWRLIQEAR